MCLHICWHLCWAPDEADWMAGGAGIPLCSSPGVLLTCDPSPGSGHLLLSLTSNLYQWDGLRFPAQCAVNVYWMCTIFIYPIWWGLYDFVPNLLYLSGTGKDFWAYLRISIHCQNENRMESLNSRPLIPSCLGSFQVVISYKDHV